DLPAHVCLLALAATGGPSDEGSGPGPGPAGAGGTVDPADLVGGGGGWGLKSLTVVGRGRERVLMLDLLGSAGRGPFALAAEGWGAEVVAGMVLPRRRAELA